MGFRLISNDMTTKFDKVVTETLQYPMASRAETQAYGGEID